MKRINEHNHHVEVPMEGERNETSNCIKDLRKVLVVHGGKFLKSCISDKAGEYGKDNSAKLFESGATDVSGSQKSNTRESINLEEEKNRSIGIIEN